MVMVMRGIVVLSLALCIAFTTSYAVAGVPGTTAIDNETFNEVSSLRRTRSVLAVATCNKFPKICRAKGSPGRDCCKKKCVNVKTDNLNCGECGKKCKYGEVCCKGKCKNVMYDPKNCGGCKNKCKKRSYCLYGMCSYA